MQNNIPFKSAKIGCESEPKWLADGYICDFNGRKPSTKITGYKTKVAFTSLRKMASECRRLNKLGKTGFSYNNLGCHELKYNGVKTYIQSTFYSYFIRKYPQCQFYTSAKREHLVAIRVNNKLVGLLMPIMGSY